MAYITTVKAVRRFIVRENSGTMKIVKDIKKIFLLLLISISIMLIYQTCDKSNPVSSDCPNGRSGAICKDGSSSSATGSGACSNHGGVDHWICK